MISNPHPQEILLPVSGGLIAFSIVVALTANLMPLPAGAEGLSPDFCALILAYWGIHQPRRVGFAIAFALGLLVDLAQASLFGQHALAYVLLIFAAMVLNRRILNFGLFAQSLHVFPLLLGAAVTAVLVRLLAGDEPPSAGHFLGTAIGAALWVPLCLLVRMLRIPKAGSSA